MKLDILLYVGNNCTDEDLLFNGELSPLVLQKRLLDSEIANKVFVSIPNTYSGILRNNDNIIIREADDTVSFWKELFKKTNSEHIAKISADGIFFSPAILLEMFDLHVKYLAEFTYSENLPQGLAAEIVSRELIESIPDFNEETLSLAKVVKANINQFDTELFYKDPDLRDKRIQFLVSNKREKLILENIFQKNNSFPEYETIKTIIEENPDILYIAPSYLEIEIMSTCNLDCIFCYKDKVTHGVDEMSIDLCKKIIDNMSMFKLPYTVCLGGSGEPLDHSNFYEILELFANEELVQQLIIETNGIKADMNFLSFVKKYDTIHTVVNINGYDEETYFSLHSKQEFQKVHDHVLQLHEALNGDEKRVYIQIMKIHETENFLDDYYNYWEDKKVPIILQKQNVYQGIIKDRRYSDLSPLKRTPCWHLQRDMYILANGTVGFCKQDINGQYQAISISENNLTEIWQNKKENFLNNYKNILHTAPDCKSCDEWYTFNF